MENIDNKENKDNKETKDQENGNTKEQETDDINKINNQEKKDTKDKKDKNEKKDKKEKKEKPNKEEKGDNKKGGGCMEIDRVKIKTPKGSRDFSPYQMSLRAKVFKMITDVFKKHGAVEIDTPVFELKEILMGKYGEDSKLIYDIADQDGELLALRYDLTVPFARYMASNNYPSIKRYHIGKVYRRDDPIMTKGRFREFYQCDFDIVGTNYGKMIPDAECLKVAVEILSSIKVGKFMIKVNHRKLLDAIIELSGINKDKYRTVCSSVDKLDKEPWSKVKAELITKTIDEKQCNKLWEFVKLKDQPFKLLEILQKNEELNTNDKGKEAIEEMKTLFEYLDAYKVLEYTSFDLSLARGLDYYTGLIYEGVLTEGPKVGSICGGGRYDELLGMFSSKNLPAVGISIGIERIFSILEQVYKNDPTVRATETEVLVASVGKQNITAERMKLVNEFWEKDIKAEILYNECPRLDKQNDYAVKGKIPFVVYIGENEIKNRTCKLKMLAINKEEEVSRDEIVEKLIKLVQDPSLRIF